LKCKRLRSWIDCLGHSAKNLLLQDIDFGTVGATRPFSFAPWAWWGYKPATIPKNDWKEA
jgi:hypothetical protein